MRSIVSIAAVSMAAIGYFGGSAHASEQCEGDQCTTLSVLVAYTNEAKAVTDANPVSCSSIVSDPKVTAIYSDLSIKQADSTTTQVTHPCQSGSENDEFIESNNSTESINNLINISMAELNQVYADSGMGNIKFELAGAPYAIDTDYVEGDWYKPALSINSGESVILDCYGVDYHNDCLVRTLASEFPMAGELVKARNYHNAPKAMRKLSKERAARNADIVVLLVSDNYQNLGGLALEVGVIDKKNAYTVLRASLATAPAYTFIHEVSHLLGAGHVVFEESGIGMRTDVMATDGTTTNRAIVYAETAKQSCVKAKAASQQDQIRTIMAYDGHCPIKDEDGSVVGKCPALPFISNPSVAVSYNGSDYKLGTSQCNNASILKRFAGRMSLFGEALPDIEDIDEVSKAEKMAKTYSIDLGYSKFNTLNYKTDSAYWGYWNNLTNTRKGAQLGLKNQLGQVESPQKVVKVTDSFLGKSVQDLPVRVVSDFGFDEMPPMAVSDGFTTQFPFNPGVLQISGLNPNASYTFRLFPGGKNIQKHFFETFKFSGLKTNQKQVVTHSSPNIMRFVEVKGIKPTSSGVINLRVETGKTNSGSFQGTLFSSTSLNALEFWSE